MDAVSSPTPACGACERHGTFVVGARHEAMASVRDAPAKPRDTAKGNYVAAPAL